MAARGTTGEETRAVRSGEAGDWAAAWLDWLGLLGLAMTPAPAPARRPAPAERARGERARRSG